MTAYMSDLPENHTADNTSRSYSASDIMEQLALALPLSRSTAALGKFKLTVLADALPLSRSTALGKFKLTVLADALPLALPLYRSRQIQSSPFPSSKFQKPIIPKLITIPKFKVPKLTITKFTAPTFTGPHAQFRHSDALRSSHLRISFFINLILLKPHCVDDWPLRIPVCQHRSHVVLPSLALAGIAPRPGYILFVMPVVARSSSVMRHVILVRRSGCHPSTTLTRNHHSATIHGILVAQQLAYYCAWHLPLKTTLLRCR